MITSRPPGRRPASTPIRPRRYPAAYLEPAVVRPTGRPIRLTVGPLPIRVLRAVRAFARRMFGVPPVPPPSCVPTTGPQRVAHPSRRPKSRPQSAGRVGQQTAPRCLHCKLVMVEKHRELPEPYGVWTLFACRSSACAVCRGTCRNEARVFLPPHWQSGSPGGITRL